MKTKLLAGLLVALVATMILGTVNRDLRADDREMMLVTGRISPSEWKDALGVYSQPWDMEITVRNGDQPGERWVGKSTAQGNFRAQVPVARDANSTTVEVRINGGMIYHDALVSIFADGGRIVRADTICMQRRF
ncbi:MAG TPA: hypothetical protein VGM19_07125 [Armatimonadota bacterium]